MGPPFLFLAKGEVYHKLRLLTLHAITLEAGFERFV